MCRLSRRQVRYPHSFAKPDFPRAYQQASVVVHYPRETGFELQLDLPFFLHSIVTGTREFMRGPRRLLRFLMSLGMSSAEAFS